MKLVYSALAVYALALGAARALSIDSSAVAPPADVVGEHQPLQRTFTIKSAEDLEKLRVFVPGRVFIDVEGSLPTLAPSTPAPTSAVPTATPAATKPAAKVVVASAPHTASGSSSASGSRGAGSDSEDSDEDIVFPTSTAPPKATPVATKAAPAATKVHVSPVAATANATHAPANATVAPSHASANATANATARGVRLGGAATQLRRSLKHDDSDDSSDDKKRKKREAAERVVATVVVTGNSSALLELFEAAPLHEGSESGLALRLKNADARAEGFVLTQIVLARAHLVRYVSAALADAVVLGDGVLVTRDDEAHVTLSTTGAGRVFVNASAPVSLEALSLDAAGAGGVQFAAPSLSLAGTLDASVAGSGAVAVLARASLAASRVAVAASGSGAVVVETAQLAAEELAADVFGDGAASFASAGNVTREKLTLAGSGSVLAGSIVARKADVSVWGPGTVVVQATDKLEVSTTFSGSVGYVGARPAKVKTSKWLFWRSDIVHPAAANPVRAYAAAAPPARYPVYAALETLRARHADEPVVEVVGGAAPTYLAAVSTQLAAVARGPNAFLVFSMVATTLVVVGLAANSLHKRRVRRHYRPLE